MAPARRVTSGMRVDGRDDRSVELVRLSGRAGGRDVACQGIDEGSLARLVNVDEVAV